MNIQEELSNYLNLVVEQQASDLHFTVGKPPTLRIDDQLVPIGGAQELTPEKAQELVMALLTKEQQGEFIAEKEIDFSYNYQERARFRVNAYMQKGYCSAALRLIPVHIKTLSELNLPEQLAEFIKHKQGLILAVGPAGHGKTTTIASLVDLINHTRTDHIITIEDPIEYTFTQDKSIIDQREINQDTKSFARALRSALRQDPDDVVVGEMRDLETISAALTLAETGHLIFSTLHTNDAPQTIDRMIDVFPPYQQSQIRVQLANVLTGIIAQRLVPRIGGGRIVVNEILKTTPAVRNLIRKGKSYQLRNIIQTGSQEGMVSLDSSLADLARAREISVDDAMAYAIDRNYLKTLLQSPS